MSQDIQNALGDFKHKRVLVLGDVMLDIYTLGDVSRISPEAPVPVLRKTGEKSALGGAANVAHNLKALGSEVSLVGVVGKDSAAAKFSELLSAAGIGSEGILSVSDRPTVVKHRIVSGGHQLLRVDEEYAAPLSAPDAERALSLIREALPACDIVILSDYAKGFFSAEIAAETVKLARAAGKRVIADLKPQNKDWFKGVDLLAPNRKEAEEMSGETEVAAMGRKLVAEFGCDVLITRGGDGMTVFPKEGNEISVPVRKIKVYDVAGAGDTVMAVVALSLAAGLGLEAAAMLANHAGAMVVQKPGTATLTLEELASAFHGSHVEGVEIVPKLWGYEKWLENNEKYCCKILSLNKGFQCSLHCHKNKDEMFLVTSGHVRFELGDTVMHLHEGNFVRVPPGTYHRFSGVENSLILEVSTHHDEADVYRKEESRPMEGARA